MWKGIFVCLCVLYIWSWVTDDTKKALQNEVSRVTQGISNTKETVEKWQLIGIEKAQTPKSCPKNQSIFMPCSQDGKVCPNNTSACFKMDSGIQCKAVYFTRRASFLTTGEKCK